MEREPYNGFEIECEAKRDPSEHGGFAYVRVYRPGSWEPEFGVRMFVADRYALQEGHSIEPDDVTDLAIELGTRWAHGLIDTEGWADASGCDEWIVEQRLPGKAQPPEEAQVNDDALGAHILNVFRRIRERENAASSSLDVDGFADVLRVDVSRVQRLIRRFEGRGYLTLSRYAGIDERIEQGSAEITQRGFDALDELERVAPSLFHAMETQVLGYLGEAEFAERYSAAFAKLRQATELLTGDDAATRASQVGHLCREAAQEFADALIAPYAPPDPPALKTAVTPRVRAVLTSCASELAKSEPTFLKALVDYWSATYDLVQRQEKDAVKEGQALTIEDGRRVVFHTGIMMYEVARALPPPR